MHFDELTGRSSKHLVEITIQNYSTLVNPSIVSDLMNWKDACQNEQIALSIASAFRSFDRQLLIWNEKAEGKRPLLDAAGNILSVDSLSEEEIFQSLLLWTHVPGASRHHWGTDLDVFDCNWYNSTGQKLKLENSEYLKDGPNAKLHLYNESWLKSGATFFRPYGPKGAIMSELWHYSHVKTAQLFQKNYTFETFTKNIKQSTSMHLQDLVIKNQQKIYNHYIQGITYP